MCRRCPAANGAVSGSVKTPWPFDLRWLNATVNSSLKISLCSSIKSPFSFIAAALGHFTLARQAAQSGGGNLHWFVQVGLCSNGELWLISVHCGSLHAS